MEVERCEKDLKPARVPCLEVWFRHRSKGRVSARRVHRLLNLNFHFFIVVRHCTSELTNPF